jgi:8-oxo-dGTP diphosphatase
MPTLTMTTDIVIFTIRDERLEVLLIQRGNPPFQGSWALPGGLVEQDESLDNCAHRELEEETGLSGLLLEQLHTFGAPDRDPRGRIVTAAYYTLVRAERVKPPRAADDAAAAGWFALDRLPPLAFDHATILEMARRRLLSKLRESPGVWGFLPKAFSLGELRALFEAIRGAPLDVRKFRRWATAGGLLEESGARRGGSARQERLYRATRSDWLR